MFGQSAFQSVLERLRTQAEARSAAPQSPRVRGLQSVFAAHTLGAAHTLNAARAHIQSAYRACCEDSIEPPAPPVMPAYLAQLDPREIAAELAIGFHDTPPSLGLKRRAFARINHPDRVHSDYRDNATRRMMIANMLIDRALSEARTRFPV